MSHVRRGDLVVVTKGRDKGKQGRVLRIVGDRLVVEKVHMVKRHTKAAPGKTEGGIIDKEGTIHISNVALFDEKTKRGTRTKVVVEAGKKIRVGVKSGTKFTAAGL